MRLHRHRWVRHPRFGRILVRRCEVCGRVETTFRGPDHWFLAGEHLQPKLTGWFRLPPFGLFLEVPRTREV